MRPFAEVRRCHLVPVRPGALPATLMTADCRMSSTSVDPQYRATPFVCEKRPAVGSRGMAVTNHPLASAAAAEILLGGGNAVDAAVAALFALTVVEPMMVGILGGGVSHVRLPDGRHVIIDNLSSAPKAARADMYEPVSDGAASARDTRDRRNAVGASAVAVPGSLAGWTHMLAEIRNAAAARGHAAGHSPRRGRVRSHILSLRMHRRHGGGSCPRCRAGDALPSRWTEDSRRHARRAGGLCANAAPHRRRRTGRSLSWRSRQRQSPIICRRMAARICRRSCGLRAVERAPVSTEYRGRTVIGPPPPASGGVHIAQMLNILEGFDIGAMGFGSPDSIHLLAEILKIAFADRAVTTADPAFVKVPVEQRDIQGICVGAPRGDRPAACAPIARQAASSARSPRIRRM